MTVTLFVFVVLEDLVVLVPSLDQVSCLLPKNCSIACYLLFVDLTFVTVKYKAMFLHYFHQL